MHSIQSFDCTKLFKDLGHDLQRLTDLASRARHELPHHILTMRELISAGRIPGVEFSAHLLSTLLDSLLAGPSAMPLANSNARLREGTRTPSITPSYGSRSNSITISET